jgi:2-polyprenyl-3-methyl-5-hydroxy-6-metoxy-1,4-benzoquinol methylase
MDTGIIDPLAPSRDGTWSAPGVQVRRRVGPHAHGHRPGTICTPRFCAHRSSGLLTVEHTLTPHQLCDELAVQLADELVDSGALHGQSEFELVFTGVVRSTIGGGASSWLRFYRNSLARLESGKTAFAPIHQEAADLVRGHSVVDLGSCFGFFPLRLSHRGTAVTATDLSGPTMRLLELASIQLGRPLRTLTCDAATVPLPDGSADTVTALHLLEHLDNAAIDSVLAEALRLARRRVVVAVPFEDEPRACYGHIQRFDLTRLQVVGARLRAEHSGVHATVHEFHGGWLVLDK